MPTITGFLSMYLFFKTPMFLYFLPQMLSKHRLIIQEHKLCHFILLTNDIYL